MARQCCRGSIHHWQLLTHVAMYTYLCPREGVNRRSVGGTVILKYIVWNSVCADWIEVADTVSNFCGQVKQP